MRGRLDWEKIFSQDTSKIMKKEDERKTDEEEEKNEEVVSIIVLGTDSMEVTG